MRRETLFEDETGGGPGDGEPRAGPLAGLTFVAADLLDVAGWVTGRGNPRWAATHPAATLTHPAISALRAAGARLMAKTVVDELGYGLTGENPHYGAPLNPLAPSRLPGGACGGAAAAVAGRLADFALGLDAVGEVRVPASLCGLFAFRPGRGARPPGFDTLAWMARDAAVLGRVGGVLLADAEVARNAGPPTGVLLVEDAFAETDAEVRAALSPLIDTVTAVLGSPSDVSLTPTGLAGWGKALRIGHGWEFWNANKAWLRRYRQDLGPALAKEVVWLATLTDQAAAEAAVVRAEACRRLEELLADGSVLCLPTVPTVAPSRRGPPALLEEFRDRALALSALASLAGLPQVTLPLAELEGCPVGLSLIARRGGDLPLLAAASRVAA